MLSWFNFLLFCGQFLFCFGQGIPVEAHRTSGRLVLIFYKHGNFLLCKFVPNASGTMSNVFLANSTL